MSYFLTLNINTDNPPKQQCIIIEAVYSLLLRHTIMSVPDLGAENRNEAQAAVSRGGKIIILSNIKNNCEEGATVKCLFRFEKIIIGVNIFQLKNIVVFMHDFWTN